MKYIYFLIVLVSTCGCSLSFINVMTSGEATDVVDSVPTSDVKTDADIDANLPAV